MVHQFEAHPLLPSEGQWRFALRHGVVPMAHSCLGGVPGGLSRLAADPTVQRAAAATATTAANGSVALAPLLVAWALGRGGGGAVVSSGSPSHARELLHAPNLLEAANRDRATNSAAVGSAYGTSAALVILGAVPKSHHLSRAVPEAFGFLFGD